MDVQRSWSPKRERAQRLVFDGWIAGLGTTSGVRIVLGHWPRSPFGPISDVMLERADGHRVLLAPSAEVAAFIAATYSFDAVEVVAVTVAVGRDRWRVEAGQLEVEFITGRRGPLGWLLRLLAAPLAARPWFVAALDLPARLLLPGVRTRGSAGNGRREWYGARDLLTIRQLGGSFAGADLGSLTAVDPPVRFGFGSVPSRPGLVRVTTTIEMEPGGADDSGRSGGRG
jgi:hypothetical protein